MSGKARILIVDDEASVREVLSEMLASEGYETEQARDGDDALARIHARDFDLVVLDIMMPKVNGLEVIEGIKRSKPGLKIVVLSAIGKYDEKFFDVVLGNAVDARIEKPVQMGRLLDLVAGLLP